MNTIDLRAIIESKNSNYFDRYPSFISNMILTVLKKLIRLDEINNFLEKHADKKGIDFVDTLFEHIDFGYLLSNIDREKIPADGKLICVANHPLGALDGLAIMKAISEIRRDVKIVANDVLMNIENLRDVFLPYDLYSKKVQRRQVENIRKSLSNEEAIIFFPAAEVSRLSLRGIHDRKWMNGPVYFAQKYQAPILPIYVKARNSAIFYLTSFFSHKISMFMLAREILRKRNESIRLNIGDPIPSHVIKNTLVKTRYQTKLLRRHVYRTGKQKSGIFTTEKTIIHPVDRKLLKMELSNSKLLTTTSDGKKIYLVVYDTGPNIVREIARLREVTFRKVGEGTGMKYDFDEYDKYYKHIVLWDEEALEIVGSYRLGLSREIIENKGFDGLYNASLFSFSESFKKQMKQSVELGRSFIQQKYWKSYALDYLWQGIGVFLHQNEDVKYLFGAVSISDNYTEDAKRLIIYFYRKWYGLDGQAFSNNRFIFTKQAEKELSQIFNNSSIEEDYRVLKSTLKNYGYSIPVLFKKYSELCEQDGVRFLDFGVDEDFSNCVDGLVFLELEKLKQSKRKRYFPAAQKPIEAGQEI
ncbi:GNAT family N-acetyltransferase [candidate division KSB1 bacterium]|nr:GNAT family N-acetyltransferase [candidate division KSB1 bacterium]